MVCDYVKPAALQVPDSKQFGAVPRPSTTLALLGDATHLGMVPETEQSFFDYSRKAFDLIDHGILVSELRSLDLPVSIINWIIDFLSDRFQRVKFVEGCVSEWGSVPSRVTLGARDFLCAVSGFGPAQKASGPERYSFENAEPIAGTVNSV